MGTFNTHKIINAEPSLIPAMANKITEHFKSQGYEVDVQVSDLGTYDKAAIPNETVAVNVAQQIFDGMRKSEEMEKHVPLSVFFDTKDEIWIVTFNEPFDEATGTIRVGGGYSFAIQKSDGKVLRIWMNE